MFYNLGQIFLLLFSFDFSEKNILWLSYLVNCYKAFVLLNGFIMFHFKSRHNWFNLHHINPSLFQSIIERYTMNVLVMFPSLPDSIFLGLLGRNGTTESSDMWFEILYKCLHFPLRQEILNCVFPIWNAQLSAVCSTSQNLINLILMILSMLSFQFEIWNFITF